MSQDEGARTGSRGPLFGGLLLAVVAALGVWWFLRGEETADAPGGAEAEPTAKTVVTNTAAAPQQRRERALPPPTGECGLSLRVVDWQGDPVAGALIDPKTEPETAMVAAHTDATGRARVEPIACGSEALVFVQAEPWPRHLETFSTDQIIAGEEIELALPRFLLVTGQVQDESGAPLPQASLFSGANLGVETDDEARFRIWVKPRTLDELGGMDLAAAEADPELAAHIAHLTSTLSFHANAPGYRTEFVEVPLPADPSVRELEQDFVMHPERQVQVRCEGRQRTDCLDVNFLTCSAPGVFEGESCHFATQGKGEDKVFLDHKLCPCPVGEAVVRGDGEEVAVAPGDEAVVLVFSGAKVTGTLLVDGVPARRNVDLIHRARSGLDHVGIEQITGHRSAFSRSKDGRFLLEAAPAGPASLWCHADGVAEGRAMVAEIVVPESGTLDVGELECRQGGGISGHLVDRENGDRLDAGYGGVLAQKGGRGTVVFATAAEEGGFSFDALPAGAWTLWSATDPTATTVVTVEDGVETEGVVIRAGRDPVLPRTGLVIAADEDSEDGSVRIRDVLPDSPAARAGLNPGDVLVRGWVDGLAMGYPAPPDEPDSMDADMAGWVFMRARGYDGPGLTFTVDRDGEEVPVAFDW